MTFTSRRMSLNNLIFFVVPKYSNSSDRKASRVNLLIEHCADLSVKNKAGLSALYFINKKVPQCMKSLGKIRYK